MISIWRQSLELVEEGGLKVILNRVSEIGAEGGYIPAHNDHIEISFHFSLLRPSETLWFRRDAGTTVFERFALVIGISSFIG